jgi:hypothetical protein
MLDTYSAVSGLDEDGCEFENGRLEMSIRHCSEAREISLLLCEAVRPN